MTTALLDRVTHRPHFFEYIGSTSKKITFYFVRNWNEKIQGKNANLFTKIHKKYCPDAKLNFNIVSAFDALNIILESHKRNRVLRGLPLVEDIKKHEYDGVMGKVSYGKSNDPQKRLFIYQIKNNARELYKEIF